MEANSKSKEEAQKCYPTAKWSEETGVGSIIEVNSAQVQLIQADLSYCQSICNYMSAQADFDKAVGADF